MCSSCTKDAATKNGKVTTGRICIDSGGSIDVVEDVVIRDRQHLSEDGIILPIIAINKRTGRVEGPPEIVMRGFALDDPQLVAEARAIVQRTLEASSVEEKQDLRRHQGKDPQRPQALYPEIDQPQASHHARHHGDLKRSLRNRRGCRPGFYHV